MRRMPAALDPVLFVPGLVYGALIRARNALYASGALPRVRLPAPVLSVGNLTLGGTGKTPMVLYIARLLRAHGYEPAVLTRGYGRANAGTTRILPPGAHPLPDADPGDEPAVMLRHLPYAWMGISKDRVRAGRAIVNRARRPVFILDDGFQHRRLHRDLDLVMVDRSQPFGRNRVFPRGTLREPAAGLGRCHAVVLNGPMDEPGAGLLEEEIRKFSPEAVVFHARQTIDALLPFDAWRAMDLRPGAPRPRRACLVAAVGNPRRFRRDIELLGIEVTGTRFFRDHYRLQDADWQACTAEARSRGADALITTEKDAVKCGRPPGFPLWVAVQATTVSDAAAFEEMLLRCVQNRTEMADAADPQYS